MPKKAKTVFVCQECGYESPKWLGQCVCGAWNSFVEEKVQPEQSRNDTRRRVSSESGGKAKPLNEIGSADKKRMNVGINELKRVLGGGLVRGSLVLISGEPGIGKSTLIIQAAANIASEYGRVLYVTGEESEEQVKLRADRVCGKLSDNLYIMAETDMENVFEACQKIKPCFLVIDSIQTMYTGELDSAPGSVSQVRACGNLMMKIGKAGNIPAFIVAHVTKSGDLAGPKIVEHLVDVVLNFSGERDHDVRILRAFKNRFGTTREIGAFKMSEGGLAQIDDISASFLESTDERAEGSVISAVYEGSRPVFLEVQALTSHTVAAFPRRTAVGFDYQRLNMILAVLEKRLGVITSDKDVYVNIVGGLKPDSTSVDLAVALAVISSVKGILPACRTVALGEVGLTGDLRSIRDADKIAAEAGRMGYERIILPAKNAAGLIRDAWRNKKTAASSATGIAEESKNVGSEKNIAAAYEAPVQVKTSTPHLAASRNLVEAVKAYTSKP